MGSCTGHWLHNFLCNQRDNVSVVTVKTVLKDVLEPFRPDPHLLPRLFTIHVRMVGLAVRGAGKFDCDWYVAL